MILCEINDMKDKKIYLTILTDQYQVGDELVLEKDLGNPYDDEAILVVGIKNEDELRCGDYAVKYVANSVNTVVHGTYSAGRIYDKFEERLIVKVCFVFKRMAIAEVVGEMKFEKD